jgi:sarcosine oxidase subunit alpha
MPRIFINKDPYEADPGSSVAAAILQSGKTHFRTSVSGQPRAPICGMGICYECRVTINGIHHQRSCLIPCELDMEVEVGT